MGVVMDSRCSALSVLGIFLMKKELLAGIAMLLLATGAAHAKTSKLPTVKVIQFMTSLPPAEYDKPYTGELTIRRLATEQEIHTICPNYGDTSHYTACAKH